MPKKVCISCGNTGNLPQRVKIGPANYPICGTCQSEARKILSLSPDDPPATVVAKLLALRNPRKEGMAVNRMLTLGIDVPWNEVDQQVESLRKLVQERRKEISRESPPKNQWLTELEEFLDEEVGDRGLDWEIDSWARTGRYRYAVKIGIYPCWGEMFLEGTTEEIKNSIVRIIESVSLERLKCPFCGTEQIVGADERKRCAVCGARFRYECKTGGACKIQRDEAWKEISDRLRAKTGEKRWAIYEKMLKAGVRVEELFHGVVYIGKVKGLPVYAFRGKLRTKSFDEIAKIRFNFLRLALAEAGFVPCVYNAWENLDCWKGEIDGIRVDVCLYHNMYVVIYPDVWSIPLRREWKDPFYENECDIYTRWENWLRRNGRDGDYKVALISLLDDSDREGVIWEGLFSDSWKWSRCILSDWMDKLRHGLEIYEAKVRQFMVEIEIPLPEG